MNRALVGVGLCSFALVLGLTGCGPAPATPANTEKAEAAGDAGASSASADASAKTVAEKGDKVEVNYRGTLEDGTQFDSSYDRGETLTFTVGSGQMISGFDAAVEGMKVGETKTVTLSPEEAYGERSDSLVYTFDRTDVPDPVNVKVGDTLGLQTSGGATTTGTVTEVTATTVTVDANPRLAGQTLIFEIELVAID
ncbi:FKBP-type peptidyl-prolyl cis-trans isomerase [Kribbibacterium absianum]|uniref:FKBP-type peptidyl-prolyl cis-trans isomerase n=1 Tax=Kribbibacterium absianum TaxID=3044210 RepID=UPI00321B071D